MITVLGGSGFIGSRLCKKLKSNHHSFIIADKNPCHSSLGNFTKADVRSINDLRKVFSFGGIIINLAAEHKDNVYPTSLYYDVNVSGAENLCAVAKERKIQQIIFISSVAIYGFALIDTDELGKVAPFNDYGLSKWKAEEVYKKWQSEDPEKRTLVIIRPTVVFGEGNRGNVYNLFKQIVSGKFVMVGNGLNRKSMAYVENVAAFIEHTINFKPGVHIYNYIDKPDFSMNSLVGQINKILGRSEKIYLRIPFFLGLIIGRIFDLLALLTRKNLSISSIRIKKFCANSVYLSAVTKTDFVPPVSIVEAIERTVKYEFTENHKKDSVYFND